MKVLLASLAYPPVPGPGLERTVELATALPALGIETHVLAPDDDGSAHRADVARVPTQAWVHRARFLGPAPAAPEPRAAPEDDDVFARVASSARALGRRALLPDESVGWNLTGIPAAVRIVRRHAIDGVVTVGPPHSVHLIGAALKRATGVLWLADLGERPGDGISWLLSRQADAITCGSDAIAEAVRARRPAGRVVSVRHDEGTDTADVLRSLS